MLAGGGGKAGVGGVGGCERGGGGGEGGEGGVGVGGSARALAALGGQQGGGDADGPVGGRVKGAAAAIVEDALVQAKLFADAELRLPGGLDAVGDAPDVALLVQGGGEELLDGVGDRVEHVEHTGSQLQLAVQRHHLGAAGAAAATGHKAAGQVAEAGSGVDSGQDGRVDGPLDEIHVAPEAGAPRLFDVGGHVAVGVALQEAVVGAAQLELGGGVQDNVSGRAAEVDAGDAALDFGDDGGGVKE